MFLPSITSALMAYFVFLDSIIAKLIKFGEYYLGGSRRFGLFSGWDFVRVLFPADFGDCGDLVIGGIFGVCLTPKNERAISAALLSCIKAL